MNRKTLLPAIITLAALLISGCGTQKETDVRAQFRTLIEESNGHMQNQDADAAMQKAIEALNIADANSLKDCSAEAMNSIASIDIATSRDDHAWEYASRSEELCRENGLTRDLARALLIKARICIYADMSADDNRNDEALGYLEEALKLSESIKDIPLQIDAYYSYSQVYVNKNRWNAVLDPAIYALADNSLSKGETLATANGLSDLIVRGMLFRVRLFRQASKYEEAVAYCSSVLEASKENDFLSRYQVFDQLTSLYYGLEDHDRAMECHSNTLYYVQQYISQKADEQLQKMETEYEAALKEQTIKKNRYLITCLCLALFLLASLVALLFYLGRKAKEKNVQLEHSGKAKDELISFLSTDIDIPALEKSRDSLNEAVTDYISKVKTEKLEAAGKLGLTKRELEVIRLSVKGKTAADIAAEMNISLRTVNNHKYNIFSKMGVGSTTEMTAKAHELGIV